MRSLKEYIINEAYDNKPLESILKHMHKPDTQMAYIITSYFMDNSDKVYSTGDKAQVGKLWTSFVNYCSVCRIDPTKYHVTSGQKIVDFVGEHAAEDYKQKHPEDKYDYKDLIKWAVPCLKGLWDKKAKKAAGEKFKNEYGEGQEIEKDASIENPQYTVVCRSKYGNGPVMIWDDIKGNWKDQVNGIKQLYSEETGIGYYEARPILAVNWLKLDDAHKDATCPDGIDIDE